YKLTLADGRVEELLPQFPGALSVDDWSQDGLHLLAHDENGNEYDVPLSGERKPFLFIHATGMDEARFSPDVHWVAYNSVVSGKAEIFVTAFPKSGETIKVSTNGGAQARWRRDGKELYYVDLNGQLVAVDVVPGNPIRFGIPHLLFKTRIDVQTELDQYDVTADGQRFIMIVHPNDAAPAPF